MAEAGEIVDSDAGPRFLLVNGNVQRIEGPGRIATLTFDRYVIDLAPFQKGERADQRGTQERYLPELLNPPDAANLDEKKVRSYIADAHERLSSPLYSFIFVLIPAAAILAAGSARTSIAWRIGLAALIALTIRMIGLGVRGAVGGNNDLWPLLYLVPLLGIAGAALWLSGWSRRKPLREPPQEASA